VAGHAGTHQEAARLPPMVGARLSGCFEILRPAYGDATCVFGDLREGSHTGLTCKVRRPDAALAAAGSAGQAQAGARLDQDRRS